MTPKKKDFSQLKQPSNPALNFMTEPEASRPEKDAETKTKRLNLLLKPSLHEKTKKIAYIEQTSVNDLINTILEAYAEENKEAIALYDKLQELKK